MSITPHRNCEIGCATNAASFNRRMMPVIPVIMSTGLVSIIVVLCRCSGRICILKATPRYSIMADRSEARHASGGELIVPNPYLSYAAMAYTVLHMNSSSFDSRSELENSVAIRHGSSVQSLEGSHYPNSHRYVPVNRPC